MPQCWEQALASQADCERLRHRCRRCIACSARERYRQDISRSVNSRFALGPCRAYAAYYTSFPAVAIVVYFLRTRQGYHSLPEAIHERSADARSQIVNVSFAGFTSCESCMLHGRQHTSISSNVAQRTDMGR